MRGVAERTRPVFVPARPTEQSTTGHDDPAAEASRRRQPDDWRWIPDPAEGDGATPSGEHELSDALLRGMVWANLHYWG
jgi:hypothetical protein